MTHNQKFLIGVCITIFSLFCFLGLRKEGIRYVPTASDFRSEGSGPRYEKAESLYIELANILPQARRVSSTWRCCSLGIVYTDSIKSNPVFDSIQGTVVIASGAGGVDIDTIKECDIITGAPNIDTIAGCDRLTATTILTTTTITSGAGGVDIDTIKECDKITGAPDIDSITSCVYIGGATVLNDSVKVGGSGQFLTQITQSSDTLYLIIGDSTAAIVVDNKYATE